MLCAIEDAPSSGAVAAYRAAITRHGRNLQETAGPDARGAALACVRAANPEYAEDREAIITVAWAGFAA